MNYLSISQLASVSDLQRNYSGLLDRIKKIAKPLYLLRRNQPEAVLISIKDYEDLIAKTKLYELKVALGAIKEFDKEKKAGRLLKAKKPEDLLSQK